MTREGTQFQSHFISDKKMGLKQVVQVTRICMGDVKISLEACLKVGETLIQTQGGAALLST